MPCLCQIHLVPRLCDQTLWNLFRSLADILTHVPQRLQGCSPSTPQEVEGPLPGFTASPVLPAIKMLFYFFFSLTTTSFGHLLCPFLEQAQGHGPSLGFYLYCNCCWHLALFTPSCTVSDHHSIPLANLSVNCLKLPLPQELEIHVLFFPETLPDFVLDSQTNQSLVGRVRRKAPSWAC